jgi:hypothetical protein
MEEKSKRPHEEPSLGGKILEWALRKWGIKIWTRLI